MFTSRLFWKVFLSQISVVLVTAIGLAVVGTTAGAPEASSVFQPGVAMPVALIAVVTAFVFSWLTLKGPLRQIRELTEAAEAMADGDVDQEVPIHSRDEIGALADVFNTVSQDVSSGLEQLEQRNRQIEGNSERLATVLGAMVEGVIAIDKREKIIFANRAAQSMFERGGSRFVGRPVWEVIRIPAVHEAVREVLNGRARRQVEFELPRTKSVIALLAARLPGDPVPGAVMVLHDLTELRRLESLRRDFVSNVSHELKTPLTSIQAYAETLLSGALEDPEHGRAFVSRIEEQADRLHSLILDLLRLTRIESGRDVFEVTTVSLNNVVAACIEACSAVAESKNVSLLTERPPGDVQVQADAEAVRTILDNLVENAINYTPAGGRVTVRWSRDESDAVLAVSDTGIGIPEEHQQRIFERFYRVDKARSRDLGGTGLGLAIVKHLAQEFGGEVRVESLPGEGSTFSVRLPLA